MGVLSFIGIGDFSRKPTGAGIGPAVRVTGVLAMVAGRGVEAGAFFSSRSLY
jgi:hypothetical protein